MHQVISALIPHFPPQHMFQGVTRVDDPVASFDLCQEADVADAVAGMIPVLKKSADVSLVTGSS
jgi:hypothetical protein